MSARFRPLVDTYGATRYADVDPTPFAAASFVLMFGMMFGDVGHGLLLAAFGLCLRRTRGSPRCRACARCGRSRSPAAWPPPAFGLLYGEAFGPTGLVPALWVSPLDDYLQLLPAAVGVGALLLSVGYALGILNRWREGGLRAALMAPSGIAGFATFAGGGLIALAVFFGIPPLAVAGVVVAVGGMALLLAGFTADAGLSPAGITQALVELLDAVVAHRREPRVVRAAGGLRPHARGARARSCSTARGALWGLGPLGAVAAVVVFVVGSAAAFALEALVAVIQAMRLEYYELFSRVYAGEGRAVPALEDSHREEGPARMIASLLLAAPVALAAGLLVGGVVPADPAPGAYGGWSRSTPPSALGGAGARRRPGARPGRLGAGGGRRPAPRATR